MAPKRLSLTILMATWVLTGCSGRSLRDLISRNEYVPIEEIEAEGQLSPSASSSTALVSDDSSESKRRFRLPRFWKRDSENDLQDPFETAEETTVAQADNVQSSAADLEQKARDYSKRLQELEERAKQLAAEQNFAQEAIKGASQNAPEFSVSETKTAAAPKDNLKSQSFADFMKSRENDQNETTETSPKNQFVGVRQNSTTVSDTDVSELAAMEARSLDDLLTGTAATAKSNKTSAQDAEAESFDQFVSRSQNTNASEPHMAKSETAMTPRIKPNTRRSSEQRDRFETELFPDLEAALAEVEPTMSTPPVPNQVFVNSEAPPEFGSPQAKEMKSAEDAFSQMLKHENTKPALATSQPTPKNAFGSETRFDEDFLTGSVPAPKLPTSPDEAFFNSEESHRQPPETSNPFAIADTPTSASRTDSTGFQWSHIPTRQATAPAITAGIDSQPSFNSTPSRSDQPMFDQPVIDTSLTESRHDMSPRQIPTDQSDPFRQVSTSTSVVSSAEPFSNSGLTIPTADSSTVMHDNFADAMPFDSAESLATAAPANATSDGQIGGLTGRTWLFIIGCLVVLLLLFLPERQNRANG